MNYATKPTICTVFSLSFISQAVAQDLTSREILHVAAGEYALLDVRYYAAWECVKRALLKHVPNGQATYILWHTLASYFMMNGGDILVLQRILGHSKIEQTMANLEHAIYEMQGDTARMSGQMMQGGGRR